MRALNHTEKKNHACVKRQYTTKHLCFIFFFSHTQPTYTCSTKFVVMGFYVSRSQCVYAAIGFFPLFSICLIRIFIHKRLNVYEGATIYIFKDTGVYMDAGTVVFEDDNNVIVVVI